MEPGDAQDLAARIDGLEAQLVALRLRSDARGSLAVREVELGAEIHAVRARLDARAQPKRSLLDDVRVASPCPASWDEMEGDDRVRHCKACDRQVFYLSAMTRLEAETLLAEHASPCVRLWRRADGTVMTSDCPVGRRRMRVRNVIAVAGSAAVLAALAIVQRDPQLPDVRDAECGLDKAQNRAERVAEAVKRNTKVRRPLDPNYFERLGPYRMQILMERVEPELGSIKFGRLPPLPLGEDKK
jgi:hypothetical protein